MIFDTICVTFWWKILPIALLLGVFSIFYLTWWLKKSSEAVAEATDTIAEEAVEGNEHLSNIAASLEKLAVYQPKDRKENFIIGALGSPEYSHMRVSEKIFVASALIQNLIQANWVVEKEIQIPEYDGQQLYLVCSKDHDEDGLPEVVVLELKLTDTAATFVSAVSDLDLSLHTLNEKVTTTEGVSMIAINCGADCGLEMHRILNATIKGAEVKVTYFKPGKPDSVPILVYSKASGQFIPDSIAITETPQQVLRLSYKAKRRGASGVVTPEGFPLSVEKMIKIMTETTAPKTGKGQRVNLGLVGAANTGKSFLLKALLAAGAAAGVQIIKATASAFAAFKDDDESLVKLKTRAGEKPTWLVIDEANGLPPALMASLASVMSGLDDQPNMSIILASNNEEDLTDEQTSNLFRVGRVDLFIQLTTLPRSMWAPLLEELKRLHSDLNWAEPPTGEVEMPLGQVYGLGTLPAIDQVFKDLSL
jgi:hypothetical protein